jgi:hypothetical protein
MKMGTTRSPWRYDVVLDSTAFYSMTRPSSRALPDQMWHATLFRFNVFELVRLSFDSCSP